MSEEGTNDSGGEVQAVTDDTVFKYVWSRLRFLKAPFSVDSESLGSNKVEMQRAESPACKYLCKQDKVTRTEQGKQLRIVIPSPWNSNLYVLAKAVNPNPASAYLSRYV